MFTRALTLLRQGAVSISELFVQYEMTVRSTYLHLVHRSACSSLNPYGKHSNNVPLFLIQDAIGQLVELAGSTLRNGGRIVYLGENSAGLLAFVDASEQPPTFGARFEDIQAFVADGWKVHFLLPCPG